MLISCKPIAFTSETIMIKFSALTAIAFTFAAPAVSADAEKGEKDFKKCRACHTITSETDVIYKGGRTGPNLYAIVGRKAGTFEGYKNYGDDLIAAGEAGLIWTEELLFEYVKDPKAFLTEQLGEKSKSKMSYRQKDASDIIAYLASVAPVPQATTSSEVINDTALAPDKALEPKDGSTAKPKQ